VGVGVVDGVGVGLGDEVVGVVEGLDAVWILRT
jgi:hypothetical protein